VQLHRLSGSGKLSLLVDKQMKLKGAIMNTAFRLAVSLLIVIGVAGFTKASSAAEQVNLVEFASHPEALAGRIIEVNARVIAISADGKSLELFDSQSRTRIAVRLTQLPKTERLALLQSDVRRVAVSGRASVIAGRLTIDADSVQILPVITEAEIQLKRDAERRGDEPETAVVPLVIPND
jgi:hypothetical protein